MNEDELLRRWTALAERAQVAAEARIERGLYELHGEEELYDGDGSELLAPFCGCMTCVIREALDAAYPYIKEATRLEIEYAE